MLKLFKKPKPYKPWRRILTFPDGKCVGMDFVDVDHIIEISSSCCCGYLVITFQCAICKISIARNVNLITSRQALHNHAETLINNHCAVANHPRKMEKRTNPSVLACGFCSFSGLRNVYEHVIEDCEIAKAVMDKNANDEQTRSFIMENIIADIDKKIPFDLPETRISINPAIYDYVPCVCGMGQYVKCFICGVVRKGIIIKEFGRSLVDSLYVTALIEHFGLNRSQIKFDHTDFISPIEYKKYDTVPVAFFHDNDNYDYDNERDFQSEFRYRVKRDVVRGYKCSICDIEYQCGDMSSNIADSLPPPAEIVLSHLIECVKPLRKYCEENRIRAVHNPHEGRRTFSG